MNQPSNGCGSLFNDLQIQSPPGSLVPAQEGSSHHQSQATHPEIHRASSVPFHDVPDPDFDLRPDQFSDFPMDVDPPPSNVEFYPGASEAFPGGKKFMDDFFSYKYASLRGDNLFYPFASQEDWQLGSWLLRSGLSMAEIDNFLKLDLVSI